jgi:diguanylate cyclase
MKGGGRIKYPGWLRAVLVQFDRDFQYAIILSFGLLAAVVISGFTVYRALTGLWIGAMVNALFVLVVSSIVVYTIRTGDTRRSGLMFAVFNVSSAIASSLVFERTGILWSFLGLWINFLLTHRHYAVVLNLIAISLLVPTTGLLESTVEILTYIITALLITAFGFIFSQRLDTQQRLLEQMASRDPLTGAGNRRAMKDDLVQATDLLANQGQSTTLILIDLDDFKQVNDQHGHDSGDQTLIEFANAVRGNIRVDDGFYRFGGEEFVIMLPDVSTETGKDIAAKLHESISGKVQGPAGPIRFSAGVAELRPGENWEQWLGRADKAMYAAKQAGRNQVQYA